MLLVKIPATNRKHRCDNSEMSCNNGCLIKYCTEFFLVAVVSMLAVCNKTVSSPTGKR